MAPHELVFFPEENKKGRIESAYYSTNRKNPPPIDEVRLHRIENGSGSPAHDRLPAPGIDFVASFFLPRLPLKFIS
jgi:hypothetical protein